MEENEPNEVLEDDRTVEAFGRFMSLLPHDGDIELIILKAHLLLEEQLVQIIEERVATPSALPRQMRFATRMRIAQALCSPDTPGDIWIAIKKLNDVRNEIAHRLDLSKINALVEDFIQSYRSAFIDTGTGPLLERFQGSLWSLFVVVADLVERPSAQILQLVRPVDPPLPSKSDESQP